MLGGKVLGSGTYGCILKPPLPCRGETTRPDGYVSKLMKRDDANEEYDEITKIKGKIEKIKNSDRYYILSGIRKCELGTVTHNDLEDFDTKCHAMTRHRYKKNYINSSHYRNKLRILQLPDGGKDLTHFLYRTKFSGELFMKINTAMVKLLKGGIAPLKDINVIHMDIKGDNIVYSQDKNLARLIDWGIATVASGTDVPQSIKGWPLMFNGPFTNIIFQKGRNPVLQGIFRDALSEPTVSDTIKNYRGNDLIGLLKPYIISVMMVGFSDNRKMESVIGSLGHTDYIKNIIELCGKYDKQLFRSKHHIFAKMLSEQIALAFLHFSVKNNKMVGFDEKKFYNTVFKNNCDIFGFISSYLNILMNETVPMDFRQKIYDTLIKPFYFGNKYAYTPFDVNEIADVCMKLNNFIAAKTQKPARAAANKEDERKIEKDVFTHTLSKRCPNGSRRDKKTRKCVRFQEKKNTKPGAFSWPENKRCPKGSRRNKKTRKCVKK